MAVVVPVVVETQVRRVILLRQVAQAVRVVVETAEHLLGMPQHRHAPRAQVEMVLQTLVAVVAVEDIATRATVVAVMVERELLLCVMRCQVLPLQILMQLMT